MKVVLIRHGMALSRAAASAAGVSEETRPLTAEGQRQVLATTGALYRLEPGVRRLLTSPLLRAVESAEIIARSFGLSAEQCARLLPGAAAAAVNAHVAALEANAVALVGHEPDLGHLTSTWLCGAGAGAVHFETGGFCCIEFANAPAPASGCLRYHIPAGVLQP